MKEYGHLKVKPIGDKTEKQWLRETYLANKEYINKRTGDYKTFKIAVEDYTKDQPGISTRQALQKLSRSSAAGFMGRNELQQDLFNQAMAGKKREFNQATGEKKFDARNVHYNSKTKEWDYVNAKGEVKAHFSDIRKTGYRAGSAKYRV